MVRKGFTLVELMIVILIVAILAAVAVPLMMNRVESAKWSEARAAMGSIATNLKAWYAEHGCNGTNTPTPSLTATNSTGIGLSLNDLDGTYFNRGDYTFNGNPACAAGVVTAIVRCTGTKTGSSPSGTLTLTIDTNGQIFSGP